MFLELWRWSNDRRRFLSDVASIAADKRGHGKRTYTEVFERVGGPDKSRALSRCTSRPASNVVPLLERIESEWYDDDDKRRTTGRAVARATSFLPLDTRETPARVLRKNRRRLEKQPLSVPISTPGDRCNHYFYFFFFFLFFRSAPSCKLLLF